MPKVPTVTLQVTPKVANIGDTAHIKITGAVGFIHMTCQCVESWYSTGAGDQEFDIPFVYSCSGTHTWTIETSKKILAKETVEVI